MQYLGDIERTQSDIRFRFNTRTAAGVPVDGVGLVAVVYKDGSVTEITGAVTLTVPFDSRTGLVSVYVDASGASFTPGSNYSVVLSAGTVDGASVAGVCIAEFSIEYRNTKANVIAMESNVITDASIASGAFTSAKFAAGAFDAVWTVAARSLTTFGSLVSDIWGHATRILTAGTNIVLAKGTGVTGFNDLDATGVRSAVGLASANLDTQIADLPTVSEFNARTLASADYFVVSDYTAPDNAGIAANGVAIGNVPTLAEIEASTVLAKEATVATRATQTSVDGKPTLAQIEASTVLPTKTDVQNAGLL